MVVIGIIGLLVALLLPAVQSAREASRRSLCGNNLKQIGMSLQSYHDVHNCLPAGRFKSYDLRYINDISGCTTLLVDKSYLIDVLPELEQQALFDSINGSLSIFARENRTVFPVTIGVYSCPSDTDSGTPRAMYMAGLVQEGLASPGENLLASYTSYTGCFGDLLVTALPNPLNHCVVDPSVQAQANGVLTDVSPIRFSSISDGLSTTILVSERATSYLKRWEDLVYQYNGWYFAGNIGADFVHRDLPSQLRRDGGRRAADGAIKPAQRRR